MRYLDAKRHLVFGGVIAVPCLLPKIMVDRCFIAMAIAGVIVFAGAFYVGQIAPGSIRILVAVFGGVAFSFGAVAAAYDVLAQIGHRRRMGG